MIITKLMIVNKPMIAKYIKNINKKYNNKIYNKYKYINIFKKLKIYKSKIVTEPMIISKPMINAFLIER